jgi:hypothetical protein
VRDVLAVADDALVHVVGDDEIANHVHHGLVSQGRIDQVERVNEPPHRRRPERAILG